MALLLINAQHDHRHFQKRSYTSFSPLGLDKILRLLFLKCCGSNMVGFRDVCFTTASASTRLMLRGNDYLSLASTIFSVDKQEYSKTLCERIYIHWERSKYDIALDRIKMIA